MAGAGYTWAALEYDDFGNWERWPSFREQLLARGVIPGVWFTNGWNARATPADARFAIYEVEGDGDRLGVLDVLPALPRIPKAIVTNFSGLIVKRPDGVTDIAASQARAKPFVDAGFTCLPEVYLRSDAGDPTGITAVGQEFEARRLGFTRVQDVFGLFGGARLGDYAQWFDRPGWSAYPAEAVEAIA